MKQSLFLPLLITLSTLSAVAEPRFPTGLLPPTDEQRAEVERRAKLRSAPIPRTLPSRVVNIEHLPPVGFQIVGSCASWATIYYQKSWLEAKERGLTRPLPPEVILSPSFVFNYVRPAGPGQGSYMDDNLEFLDLYGTTTHADFPESLGTVHQLGNENQWRAAARFRNSSWSAIPSVTTDDIAALKAYLAEGNVASTAIKVYDSFFQFADGVTIAGIDNGVLHAYDVASGFIDGHAVCVIGYDDNREYFDGTETKRGALLAVNSWGTMWGTGLEGAESGGYFWISYDLLLNDMGDRWNTPFYVQQDRIGYEPHHFAVVDFVHGRFVELILSLSTGPLLSPQATMDLVPIRPVRGISVRQAIDITDFYQPPMDSWRLTITDVSLPLYQPSTSGRIREFIVDIDGDEPLVAAGTPLDTVDLQDNGNMPQFLTACAMEPGTAVSARPHGAVAEDLEGDGDVDVVVGGVVFLQDAAGSLVQQADLGGQHNRTAAGDLDNDGLVDLISTGYFNSPLGARLFRQASPGVFRFEGQTFSAPNMADAMRLDAVDADGDGDVDVVLGETVLENRGHLTFTRSAIDLPPGSSRSNISLDLDGDGALDAAAGDLRQVEVTPGSWRYEPVIRIYRGRGGDLSVAQEFAGVYAPVIVPGDYNNDGRTDLYVSGYVNAYSGSTLVQAASAMMLLQRPDRSFVDGGYPITPLFSPMLPAPSMAFDLGSDGDLDLLFGGTEKTASGAFTGVRLSTNHTADILQRHNLPPSPPAGLNATVGELAGEVSLSWNLGTDDLTPAECLNYRLRAGRQPGAFDVISPAGQEPAQWRGDVPGTRGRALAHLASGTYYWAVQSVDLAGRASDWSTESVFTITGQGDNFGDPNGDAVLDASDLMLAARMAAGERSPDLIASDLNGSGVVDGGDVVQFTTALLGGSLAPKPGGILAVGFEGGTISADGAEIIVPPGAIRGEPAILHLFQTGERPLAVPELTQGIGAGPMWRLTGVPGSLEVPLEVRLTDNREYKYFAPQIVVRQDFFSSTLKGLAPVFVFLPVERTQGQVHMFHLYGNEQLSGEPAGKSTVAARHEGTYSYSLGVLGGYGNYTTAHFAMAFPANVDTELVEAMGDDLEDAWSRFQAADMGFSYAARTSWPMAVCLRSLGTETKGFSYADVRGYNYDGLVFATEMLNDALERRTTAFHEFFHTVQGLYDPRNRVSRAYSMPPHYVLDEMTAPWVEELAAPNPATYVPPVQALNAASPFAPDGWYPATWMASTEIANLGYGLAAYTRYMARRQGPDSLRVAYEEVRSRHSWTYALSRGNDDVGFILLGSFYRDYLEGKIYPLSDRDILTLTPNTQALRLKSGQLSKSFVQPAPALSAKLYRVFSDPSFIPTLKPEHRLAFRLDAPTEAESAELLLFSQQRAQKPVYITTATRDTGVSRHVLSNPATVLSAQGVYYAMVVNKHSDRYTPANPSVELVTALVSDQVLRLPDADQGSINASGPRFPVFQIRGATLAIPACGTATARALDPLGIQAEADLWPESASHFTLSIPINIKETEYVDTTRGERWVTQSIKNYKVRMLELIGDTLTPVQTLNFASQPIDVPVTVPAGHREIFWELRVVYDLRTERVSDGAVLRTDELEWPVLLFSGKVN